MKSSCFAYWTYIKKTCEWGQVYREKNFPWVTLPARVNLSKCLYEKQLTLLPELKTASSRMLWFSRPNRVDRGWAGQVFTWRKVGLPRKVTIEKGVYPSPLFVSSVIKQNELACRDTAPLKSPTMHENSRRFILDLRIFKHCCPNIFPFMILFSKLICKLCDPYQCFFSIFNKQIPWRQRSCRTSRKMR